MDDIKWHVLCIASGIYLRVDLRLPLILTASAVGRRFEEIVEFAPPDVEIDKAAVIVDIVSLPRQTIFHLKFPSTGRSNASSPHNSYSAGDGQW